MAYLYPFTKVDEETKRAVWEKGRKIQDFDPKDWRYDICGTPMHYADHGNRDAKYGWEIDHIKPTSRGGTDDLSNLQPLQWENNQRKGDQFPWSC
jgi:5-methylcytosine-specific restriction endonuclease McrA